MITVTDRAKERLVSILKSKVDNSQATLRLVHIDDIQYGLHIDVENKGDTVIKHNGKKVLVVGEELVPNLEGTTIDVDISTDGMELTIFQSAGNNSYNG